MLLHTPTRRGASARHLAIGALAAGLSGIAGLSGCAVGPTYQAPAAPAAQRYTPGALPDRTASAAVPGGQAQRWVIGQEVRADWWKSFGSSALDALVDKAFAANPTVEAAQAALRVAQQNVAAQQGYFYPTVQASYAPSRSRQPAYVAGSDPAPPVVYNFHTAQVTVGYAPDVFGANQRQVESLQAQVEQQRFQLEATTLSLAANVVAAAVQEALLREQLATTQRIVTSATDALAIVRRQLAAGHASRLDLSTQENALAQARQPLPALTRQLAQTRNLLRALTGTPPDQELPQTFEFASLTLPAELPLSLPSQLVMQRPDVRAAEAQLRQASAQVGLAMANRLPQFNLNASLGGAGNRFAQMFSGPGQFFSLAAGVTQPIFDAGTLRHRQQAAEEGLRQMGAQYQATVITAFQNVADTLAAIETDAEALAVAAEADRSARAAHELVRQQLARGYVDRLTLLVAEQNALQAANALAQARAARLGDVAALYQALGGGWMQRDASSTAAGQAAAQQFTAPQR